MALSYLNQLCVDVQMEFNSVQLYLYSTFNSVHFQKAALYKQQGPVIEKKCKIFMLYNLLVCKKLNSGNFKEKWDFKTFVVVDIIPHDVLYLIF